MADLIQDLLDPIIETNPLAQELGFGAPLDLSNVGRPAVPPQAPKGDRPPSPVTALDLSAIGTPADVVRPGQASMARDVEVVPGQMPWESGGPGPGLTIKSAKGVPAGPKPWEPQVQIGA